MLGVMSEGSAACGIPSRARVGKHGVHLMCSDGTHHILSSGVDLLKEVEKLDQVVHGIGEVIKVKFDTQFMCKRGEFLPMANLAFPHVKIRDVKRNETVIGQLTSGMAGKSGVSILLDAE